MRAASAGSFQLGLSLRARRIASQVVAATTATALTLPARSAPRPVPAATLSGTTAIAPDGFAGVPTSVPPKVGLCLTTANTMPGRRTSMP